MPLSADLISSGRDDRVAPGGDIPFLAGTRTGFNFHRLEARSQRSDVAAAAYTTACLIKVQILLIQPLSI
jgi:hypothetical protein